MLFCVVFYCFTNIDNHGNGRGNTAQALAQWQHLMALHEATDALHWAMRIAPYFCSGMVIKIVIELATFSFLH
jgi:hypothetical protein